MLISIEYRGPIAVLTIDNPPVNALGLRVRQEMVRLVAEMDANPDIKAVVLTGAGRMFVGGADITEFERAPEPPHLPLVVEMIERATKPWTAAVHGVVLGGGFEIALGCRFRVATVDATFGLPEVSIGIIPGAGGTQRLPRIIGVEAAIPVIAEKATLGAARAAELALVDLVVEGDLVDDAVAFTLERLKQPLPPILPNRDVDALPGVWAAAEARIRKTTKGTAAPMLALASVRRGVEEGFATGIAFERESFLKLRASDEASALRYLFFAERAAVRPAELRGIRPRALKTVGVVGGGTMGTGIAAALRNAGLSVILSERDDSALQKGLASLNGIFEAAARRGRILSSDVQTRMAEVTAVVGLHALADCDLVIEAVFEDMEVKRAVFAELGRICGRTTILATNTSYLDPHLISDGLPDAERFLGMHFFSPANVMKLLEIIPTKLTSPDTLATAYELARQLAKIPVRAGVCDGFIGNRILRRYRGEAELLVRQGVSVQDIDTAMRAYGLAMGPFEMQDLAGLDISWMVREAARARGEEVPIQPGDLLVRAGRKGQKTGAGWYDYVSGDRTPRVSREAAAIIAELVNGSLSLSHAGIAFRLVGAMADEGCAILDEKIAGAAADIDLVEVHGYGFPRSKGGPMFQFHRSGLPT